MSLLLAISHKSPRPPSREGFFLHLYDSYARNDDSDRTHFKKSNDFMEQASSQLHSDGHQSPNTSSHGKDKDDENLTPLPDWPTALIRWGLCWDFHIYGFAALYLLLTLVSAVIFFKFRLRVQRLKIVYNTLILLATAAIFRAVFMLIDPYGYMGRMAGLMVGIMTQAVYPLFCACYGLTQVMLLRLTNVDVGHSRLRTLSCLLGCTLSYLFLVVVIETLVFYKRALKLLLLVDSGCFIVWSLCLGITFICSGFRLTQYAMETKRARKELNAFSNHRRSASNTAGLNAISSPTNDTNINIINVNFSTLASETTSPWSMTTTASDTVVADMTTTPSSPTYPMSSFSTSSHRTHPSIRLSRPRLKMSDRNHMMIVIATDEEDESTSSTDVENSGTGSSEKPPKRTRKRVKTKHENRSRSKTPTSPVAYSPVSADDMTPHSRKSRSFPRKRHKSSSNGTKTRTDTAASCSYTSLSAGDVGEPNRETSSKITLPVGCSKDQGDQSSKMGAITSETPLFSSSHCQGGQSNKMDAINSELPLLSSTKNHTKDDGMNSELPLLASTIFKSENMCSAPEKKANESPADEDDDKVGDHITHSTVYSVHADPSGHESAAGEEPQTFGMGVDLAFNNKNMTPTEISCTPGASQASGDYHENISSTDCDAYSTPVDLGPISCSPWENGYLADTENIFSCSSFSRLSSSLRPTSGRDEAGHVSCDMSSQKSATSHSDDDSTTSPALSERMISTMPAASFGLFRIRQSKVVQRAVHLTYFLTFLFMFACLLQLYTVFGVYGVLGTIPRPDPWPWLIFHTIFRATEVAIGFTTAAIAFITLNHRHQRAKRRHQQQQQHIEATRDCIV